MMSKRRAIAVILNRDNIREFKILANEAGYDIVGYIYVRNLSSRGLSNYKINEIKDYMRRLDASEVLFDIPLKPKQLYNIAVELGVEPKDRLEIILDIFELHSPSKEADLQIKLAELHYELARARERVRLRRMGEQTAIDRGLGAYEVDIYYNEIKRKIQSIKMKLDEERKKRELHRQYRVKKGYRTISIAGYYSSGKTTLFNYLTNMMEKVGEEPFTTLSTKFGLVKIGPWKCYIIDTIGFISDLPPFMVTAFYSTLEEIIFSDLVLLMIDVSESFDTVKRKLSASLDILNKLGYKGKLIIVGNKIDEINNELALKSVVSFLYEHSEYVVLISAKYGDNVDKLLGLVRRLLGKEVFISIKLPYDNEWSKPLSFLKEKMADYRVSYENNCIEISGYIDGDDYWAIKNMIDGVGGSVVAEEEYLDIKTDP
jgi:GTP-binding protein HflX